MPTTPRSSPSGRTGAPLLGGRALPFAGREEPLEALLHDVERAVEEGGRAVFLTGSEGSGKTRLLSVLQERAHREHDDLVAHYVDCAHTRPGKLAWSAFSLLFTRPHRIRRLVRNVAGEWLEVVPLLGPLVNAAIRTYAAIRGEEEPGRWSRGGPEVPAPSSATEVTHARSLLEYGPEEPRLLILDSMELAETEELAGASTLFRDLEDTHTLFVGAVKTERGRLPEGVRDLMLEGERLGVASRRRLPPLGREGVAQALRAASGEEPPEAWVTWMADRSEGNPASLWELVSTLLEGGALERRRRGWRWTERPPAGGQPTRPSDGGARGPFSAGREGALSHEELSEEDRRLLTLAAAEGRVFHASVVAELAGIDELEVEDRLARLGREGLVTFRGTVDDAEDVTSEYAFEGPADREALLHRLSAEERSRLEARVAVAVDRLSPG